MPRIFIVGDHWGYGEMFTKRGWVITKNLEDADLVQFCGGSDVSPALYSEEAHPQTYSDYNRDCEEQATFDYCIKLDKPMAGICRGGQFLNVMSGGSMYQDVDGHALHGVHGVHDIETGWIMNCSSTHHQMMIGARGCEVVAVSSDNLSTTREYMTDGFGVMIEATMHGDSEEEVLWYEHSKCLCFQPHPEFAGVYDCTQYYFKLIARKFGLE